MLGKEENREKTSDCKYTWQSVESTLKQQQNIRQCNSTKHEWYQIICCMIQ